MNLQEAYKKLGYKDLWANPRSPDWSAEKSDGICISIWAVELAGKRGIKGKDWLNTIEDSNLSLCAPSRLQKRNQHIKTAIEKFDSLVDVILLKGPVGTVESADFSPGRRKWKVEFFDEESGNFIVRFLKGDGVHAHR